MTTTVFYNTKNEKDFRDLTRNRKKLFLSTKQYYLERKREEGERDLERLVDTADNEGCWLFDADNSRWYNLIERHVEEGVEYGEATVGCENIFLGAGQKALELGSCSHYHTHPVKIREHFRQLRFNRRLNKELSEKGRRLIECDTDFTISVPSVEDISCYSCILTKNPTLDIDFRIASPHGMIIVKFKEGADKANEAYRAYEKMFKEGKKPTLFKRKFYSEEYERHAVSRGIDYLRDRVGDYLNIEFTFRDN